MKIKSPPDRRLLKALYYYDKTTGIFIHKRDTGRGRKGHPAGVQRPDGYIFLSVAGRSWLAHRLAWYYVHGKWPNEMDHINGIRSDNRMSNLRPATRNQNNGNSDGWAKHKRKYTLPRGVYNYSQCPGRYRSQIVVNRKQVHLGCFNTVHEAEAAYKEAAKKYFGEFAS